jgi:hypothetical protein
MDLKLLMITSIHSLQKRLFTLLFKRTYWLKLHRVLGRFFCPFANKNAYLSCWKALVNKLNLWFLQWASQILTAIKSGAYAR